MNTKTIAVLAIIVVLLAGVGAYFVFSDGANDDVDDSNNGNDNGEGDVISHYPVTVTTKYDDGSVKDMTFTEKPTKVIVLWSSTVEMMIHFGLEDYIVGAFADANDDLGDPAHQAAYDKLNFVGEKADKEIARSLNPDFILGWGSSFAESGGYSVGTQAYWNGIGVNTYIFDSPSNTMDDYYKHISDIGKIFDVEEKTNAYIEKLKNDTKTFQDKTSVLAPDDKKTYLTIMFTPPSYSFASGVGAIKGALGEMAGGVNLYTKDFGRITTEEVRSLNPDFIFIQMGDFAKFDSPQAAIDAFLAQPGLTGLTSEFLVFQFNELASTGIISADVLEEMYSAMYE